MKIVWKDVVDWEPLRICFVCSRFNGDFPCQLEAHIKTWVHSRNERKICSCSEMGFYLSKPNIVKKNRKIEIHAEWVCEKCLSDLFGTIEETFSQVKSVELGDKQGEIPSRPIDPNNDEWVCVPEKKIRLHDGQEKVVPSFTISGFPIAVGQFERFVRATGYITTVEQDTDGQVSYINNEIVEMFTYKGGMQCHACNLSLEDARAYCEWAGVRMPTEYELFAVSCNTPPVMYSGELEMSTSESSNDMVVIISFGHHKIYGRIEETSRDYDVVTCFRVCKRDN